MRQISAIVLCASLSLNPLAGLAWAADIMAPTVDAQGTLAAPQKLAKTQVVPPHQDPAKNSQATQTRWFWPLVAGIGTVVAVVGGLAVWFFSQKSTPSTNPLSEKSDFDPIPLGEKPEFDPIPLGEEPGSSVSHAFDNGTRNPQPYPLNPNQDDVPTKETLGDNRDQRFTLHDDILTEQAPFPELKNHSTQATGTPTTPTPETVVTEQSLTPVPAKTEEKISINEETKPQGSKLLSLKDLHIVSHQLRNASILEELYLKKEHLVETENPNAIKEELKTHTHQNGQEFINHDRTLFHYLALANEVHKYSKVFEKATLKLNQDKLYQGLIKSAAYLRDNVHTGLGGNPEHKDMLSKIHDHLVEEEKQCLQDPKHSIKYPIEPSTPGPEMAVKTPIVPPQPTKIEALELTQNEETKLQASKLLSLPDLIPLSQKLETLSWERKLCLKKDSDAVLDQRTAPMKDNPEAKKFKRYELNLFLYLAKASDADRHSKFFETGKQALHEQGMYPELITAAAYLRDNVNTNTELGGDPEHKDMLSKIHDHLVEEKKQFLQDPKHSIKYPIEPSTPGPEMAVKTPIVPPQPTKIEALELTQKEETKPQAEKLLSLNELINVTKALKELSNKPLSSVEKLYLKKDVLQASPDDSQAIRTELLNHIYNTDEGKIFTSHKLILYKYLVRASVVGDDPEFFETRKRELYKKPGYEALINAAAHLRDNIHTGVGGSDPKYKDMLSKIHDHLVEEEKILLNSKELTTPAPELKTEVPVKT